MSQFLADLVESRAILEQATRTPGDELRLPERTEGGILGRDSPGGERSWVPDCCDHHVGIGSTRL